MYRDRVKTTEIHHNPRLTIGFGDEEQRSVEGRRRWFNDVLFEHGFDSIIHLRPAAVRDAISRDVGGGRAWCEVDGMAYSIGLAQRFARKRHTRPVRRHERE